MEGEGKDEKEKPVYQVYKKRFLVLFLLSSVQLVTAYQSTQYTIIANIVTRYYQVSYEAVTMTAIVSVFANGLLIIPTGWMIKKHGIRRVFIIASLLDAIAAGIKCFGIPENLFWVQFVGQVFDGFALAGVTAMNMQVSRVWFPSHELARASTVALMSNTVGTLLGAFLPVVLVPNSPSKSVVANGFARMYISQAVYAFFVFTMVVFFFDEKPKTPPSKAEKDVEDLRENKSFWKDILSICSTNFILIVLANGLTAMDRASLRLLFNQMLADVFDNNNYWVSLVATLFAMARMASSYSAAHFLDRTKKYKQLVMVLSPITAVLLLFFSYGFYLRNKVLLIILPTLIGFSFGPFQSTFMNLASEVTYPVPESVSNSVLFFVMEAFLTLSIAYSWIQTQYGNVMLVVMMSGFMIVVFFITLFVKSDLKRQRQDQGYDPIIKEPLHGYSSFEAPSAEASKMAVFP